VLAVTTKVHVVSLSDAANTVFADIGKLEMQKTSSRASLRAHMISHKQEDRTIRSALVELNTILCVRIALHEKVALLTNRLN